MASIQQIIQQKSAYIKLIVVLVFLNLFLFLVMSKLSYLVKDFFTFVLNKENIGISTTIVVIIGGIMVLKIIIFEAVLRFRDWMIAINILLLFLFGYFSDLKDLNFGKKEILQVFVCPIGLTLVIAALFASCKVIKKRAREKAEEKAGSLLNDETSEEADQLNRSDEVKMIFNKISEVKNNNDAFTLSILGKWGEGKTTFMNLLEKEVESENHISFIFHPWKLNSKEAILRTYFDELERHLSFYFFDIDKSIKRYLVSINSAFKKSWLDSALSLFYPKQTQREIYESLVKKINSLDKKVWVFVDDLDRLDAQEIMEVFKLIRNTANFPNMVYVLGYDKEYVAKQLKRSIDANPYHFMEKIVNLEYDLGLVKQEIFLNYFIRKLKEIFPENLQEISNLEAHFASLRLGLRVVEKHGVSSDDEFDNLGISFLRINNFRKIKRILNALIIFKQSPNFKYFWFHQVFYLSILKTGYLKAYSCLKKDIENLSYKSMKDQENKGFITDVNENMETLIKKLYKEDKRGQKEVMYIIKELFSKKSENSVSTLAISHIEYYHYYFNSQIFTIDIKHFEDIFSNTFELTQIEKWIKEGLDKQIYLIIENKLRSNLGLKPSLDFIEKICSLNQKRDNGQFISNLVKLLNDSLRVHIGIESPEQIAGGESEEQKVVIVNEHLEIIKSVEQRMQFSIIWFFQIPVTFYKLIDNDLYCDFLKRIHNSIKKSPEIDFGNIIGGLDKLRKSRVENRLLAENDGLNSEIINLLINQKRLTKENLNGYIYHAEYLRNFHNELKQIDGLNEEEFQWLFGE
ncbi:MAG: KAP family NTPase [Flavobacteriales bacterium]|jgi:hypothetical protein|nr:KAP family NTPase [Flavobacteriales bacterium]